MSDQGLDTIVAGVRCREVLDALSEYLDGLLPPARVTELQAHLAGCDRCARFGGDVARVLASLRDGLREPPKPIDVTAAVMARLQS
jgi:anti-sigma factor RsiW